MLDRPTKKAVADKACKHKVLEERPSKDPVGIEYSLDSDCDDEADYLMIVPDRKREAITYLFDDDGDGKIDSIVPRQRSRRPPPTSPSTTPTATAKST